MDCGEAGPAQTASTLDFAGSHVQPPTPPGLLGG